MATTDGSLFLETDFGTMDLDTMQTNGGHSVSLRTIMDLTDSMGHSLYLAHMGGGLVPSFLSERERPHDLEMGIGLSGALSISESDESNAPLLEAQY